jgi:catechol 2,3-dioxygenase-like lactoylglutathione lyase family enzyme
MLKEYNSSAIVAVSDIGRARAFYRDVLGLELADESMDDVLAFSTGATQLTVYQSEYAGTNRANVVWGVGDEIDAIVTALEAKGARLREIVIAPHPQAEQTR